VSREWHVTRDGAVRVTARRWVDFFHAHYSHALGGVADAATYVNESFAATVRANRARAARGSFDAVSWSGGSFWRGERRGVVLLVGVATGRRRRCARLVRGLCVSSSSTSSLERHRAVRFRDELVRVLLHAGFAAHFVAVGDAWAVRFSDANEYTLERSRDSVRSLSDADMAAYRERRDVVLCDAQRLCGNATRTHRQA
jgi:hypothetical protein